VHLQLLHGSEERFAREGIMTFPVYTCDLCGETFEGRDDAEAVAEAEQLWGRCDKSQMSVVCDDCFKKFMGWYEENEDELLDA
jgi:hypothetical protein